MKRLACLIIGMLSIATASAQSRTIYRLPPPPPTPEQISKEALRFQAMSFVPADPWREIDGLTHYAKGSQWVQFVGRVQQVHSDGIRVKGFFAQPGYWPTNKWTELVRPADHEIGKQSMLVPITLEFFVKNFPHAVAEDEVIGWEQKYSARLGKTHSYDTAIGSSRTLRALDYGKVVSAPAPRQKTDLEKFLDESKRADAKARQDEAAFKHYEKLANSGDPFGQFRLGECYLNGTGVEKDKDRALDLFKKAKQGGHEAAAKLIDQLANR